MNNGVATQAGARALISPDLWSRLCYRVMTDASVGEQEAKEVLNETLEFLVLCAGAPNEIHRPSARADLGWHAFILHTLHHISETDSSHEPPDVLDMLSR